ncbi:polysaccharide deacetylase family protein [Paenibacillus sepulcri]|uniref:Polysaccharide deacetylase family protein n=1 Tax=Paenibacillus sepulcri TaxID=359917 RepID=A0ABS7CAY3_9BACL|nr:polysaccharide deacetylase family protein [Paenibacillus sepulcri]
MGDMNPFPFFPYEAIVDRPPVKWPNGARVAVWVVPNIEHFHIDKFTPSPDIRNYSRRDYGNRVGIWRLMEVLEKNGVKGTVALNGEAALFYPRIMEEAIKLDWEFMGHGMTNSVLLNTLTKEGEGEVIEQTRAIVEGLGSPMRGWLGPGLAETWDTLDLLKQHGVEYVCDWVNDDLPYRMNNGLYSIPYSIELNDMPLFNMPSISAEDFCRRICDTFDVLYEEGGTSGRVMGIALHPFLIGAPHRIKYLDKALSYIASHEDVWFAKGGEIIDAFKQG